MGYHPRDLPCGGPAGGLLAIRTLRIVTVLFSLLLCFGSGPKVHAEEPGRAPQGGESIDPGRLVKGIFGTYRLPTKLKETEVCPVLVVDGAALEKPLDLWAALRPQLRRFVLVATVDLSAGGKRQHPPASIREAIENALQECASYHRALPVCPWVLVAAGGRARQFETIAFANATRFQGLLALEGGLAPASLPADLSTAASLRVGIVDTAAASKAMQERLTKAGLKAKVYASTAEGAATAASAAFVGHFVAGSTAMHWFEQVAAIGRKSIRTQAADGLEISADLYETGNKKDPLLLLFHQAHSSRGEYGVIAPRLVKAGFNCLAIDQRSGAAWSGIRNETAARAETADLDRAYIDARPDLDRAVSWARELGFSGKLAVVGSSYSSALVIFVGAETEGLSAVVSFSPGDYLPPRGSIFEAGKKLTLPTLILCPPREERQATEVFEHIASEAKFLYVQPDGVHGASTLYRSKSAEQAWSKLLAFLKKHLR